MLLHTGEAPAACNLGHLHSHMQASGVSGGIRGRGPSRHGRHQKLATPHYTFTRRRRHRHHRTDLAAAGRYYQNTSRFFEIAFHDKQVPQPFRRQRYGTTTPPLPAAAIDYGLSIGTWTELRTTYSRHARDNYRARQRRPQHLLPQQP